MECIALKGSDAAAGLLVLPLAPALPRAAEEAFWAGPVADEERADWLAAVLAVGTWTIPRQAGSTGGEDARVGGRGQVQVVEGAGGGLEGRHRIGRGEGRTRLRLRRATGRGLGERAQRLCVYGIAGDAGEDARRDCRGADERGGRVVVVIGGVGRARVVWRREMGRERPGKRRASSQSWLAELRFALRIFSRQPWARYREIRVNPH
jgi:hypothetical protein